MPIRNASPHAAAESVARDARGCVQIVVSVKAAFRWDREVFVGRPPEPLREADAFAGDPCASALAFPAEVGPPKPLVDVLLAGALTFAEPTSECEVTLAVGRRLRKTVRVWGPRRWTADLAGRIGPSRPERTTRVPIDWALSFGGTDPADPALVERRNPVGSGIARLPDALLGHAVPQFEDPQRPIQRAGEAETPIGFGAIAPHWQPRIAFAGTYDEQWRNNRSPLPPEDFDPRFFNCAPPDQQLPSYEAGEELLLAGDRTPLLTRLALPAFAVPITFVTATAVLEREARVDTILVEPEARTLTLIARAAFVPVPNVLVYREAIVGDLSRGQRRALETGKRYLARAATEGAS